MLACVCVTLNRTYVIYSKSVIVFFYVFLILIRFIKCKPVDISRVLPNLMAKLNVTRNS